MEHEKHTAPEYTSGETAVTRTPAISPSPPISHTHVPRRRHGSSTQHDTYAATQADVHRVRSTESHREYVEANIPRWTPGLATSRAMAMDNEERPEKRLRLNPSQPELWENTPVPLSPNLQSQSDRHEGSTPRSVNSFTGAQSVNRKATHQCEECSQSGDDLHALISALIELPNARFGDSFPQDSDRRTSEVTKHGLKYGLTWAAIEARRLVALTRGSPSATATSRTLPPLLGSVLMGQARQDRPTIATPSYGPHGTRHTSDIIDSGSFSRRASISHDQSFQPHGVLPPIVPPDDMKRQRYTDQPLTGSTASSYPSSGSSLYAPIHSPPPSQVVGRALPSPPGMLSNTLSLPATPSTPTNVAAQATHLQDLQHQISTKTLALQTLQREHDQLLAAFSRSQIRCSTLDKKSQVSDHEINNLTEEKIRLQQQVESLEDQIESLTKARDSVQQQSSADGAQWRQIMAMSSQLQSKSIEEARNHHQEKEEWQRQRERLEERIREMELVGGSSGGGAAGPPRTRAAGVDDGDDDADASEIENHDILNSTSVNALRSEIRNLRRRCLQLEAALKDVTGEAESLDQAMKAMANIRARIGRVRDQDEAET